MTDAPSVILDSQQIQAIIPHRYPFLLVDRIVELSPASARSASRTLPSTNHFFRATFPDYPVMPGVLIVEAMAQVGAVALLAPATPRTNLPSLPASTAFGSSVRSSRATPCAWR